MPHPLEQYELAPETIEALVEHNLDKQVLFALDMASVDASINNQDQEDLNAWLRQAGLPEEQI